MRPVLIAGPTASGKSELALRLAERDRGCVINADAAQVYACWRVLTARPGDRDLGRAPHALYGHVPCDETYSVGSWLRDLTPHLDAAARAGQRVIIVGGTGLYMTALTEGLVEVPPVSAQVRARSTELLATGRIDRLRADLAERDPKTLSGLDAKNPRRLQRAWDVLMTTGRGLADWQRMTPAPLLDPTCCERLLMLPGKARTDRAIAGRFRRMVDAGALDECRAYRSAGGDPARPAGRVLGAADLFAFLDGTCTLDEAVERAVIATIRFAKRQRTWFRSRMADWTTLDPDDGDLLSTVPACDASRY